MIQSLRTIFIARKNWEGPFGNCQVQRIAAKEAWNRGESGLLSGVAPGVSRLEGF